MMRFDKKTFQVPISGKGTIQVLIGPFKRAKVKRFKENLNRLIQHIWAEANSRRHKEGMHIGLKEGFP